MPIVDHNELPETPWRPNVKKWDVTRSGDGTTSSSLSQFSVQAGAGASLHEHESDELIVVLAGAIEARLGDDVREVGPDSTVVVPPHVPHGFTSTGPDAAKILAFFPIADPFDHTTFLEGGPPSVG